MEKNSLPFCIFYSCQIEVIDAKRKPRGFQIASTPKEIKEVNASHVSACSVRDEVRKLDWAAATTTSMVWCTEPIAV